MLKNSNVIAIAVSESIRENQQKEGEYGKELWERRK